jgi:hypothetical protein
VAEFQERQDLLSLAAKYVWWTPPEKVLAEETPRLVASVMELGTWEDAAQLLEIVGPEIFLEVLASPPAGTISDRSLAFWHYRLGRPGAPPKSRRRFE